MPTKKDQEYFDRTLEISKVGTWYSAKAMIKWYEVITVIRTHKRGEIILGKCRVK